MPQYRFYTVSSSWREMYFSELFWDCCKQAEKFRPLECQSGHGALTLDKVDAITHFTIPEPTCLGDFIKLLLARYRYFPLRPFYRDQRNRFLSSRMKFLPHLS